MDYKRCVIRRNRDWHKRLHLRKAAQPPTMQSEDKHGPKKIAGKQGQCTAWPSSKKTPQEAQLRKIDGAKTLRFMCSQCGDDVEYVPRDLVRHFEDKHRGSPPVFPCHTCSFSTHEFSYLQVHLLSHKDTLSSCSICNDNVQRTWSEFNAHLSMCHCQNGKYSCEMCQTFSTGDVDVFLEHLYAHSLGLEGADGDSLLHRKDKNKALSCLHCGYKANHKWLITKHSKVCQSSNQRRRKKEEAEVHSIAVKPNDPPVPKIKPRLTRSAVREMCWLTEDCLTLPSKEFLDKYCHLSNPQTTLEETQQFLMKSVTGENGDQRWTKALKNVLSNVPQDISLQPKSENGIMSNSADLTVLTVKNKITVQNSANKFAKRFKLMSPADKETIIDSAGANTHCHVDTNGCELDLEDHTPENKLDVKDVSMPTQNETSKCAQMQENRENQGVQMDQKTEELEGKQEEPRHEENGNSVSNQSIERTHVHKVVTKNGRQNRQPIKRTKCKKVEEEPTALALKIVLKKNPVKEKQWMSQSSLSPLGEGPGLSSVETMMLLPEVHLQKWTKAPHTDLHDPTSEAVISTSKPEGKETLGLVGEPVESKVMSQNVWMKLDGLEHQVSQNQAERSIETEVDRNCSDGDIDPESIQTSGDDVDDGGSGGKMNSDTDGVTSQSTYNKSFPEFQPAISAQGALNSEDVSHPLSSEQTKEVATERDVSTVASPALHASCDTLPASRHRWQLPPKTLERTLKLVAINPSQLVKRPAGDQPVVVLNHPDADIPEVTRIMEVINRYRGEVQKVVLSQRTLDTLLGLSKDVTSMHSQPNPAGLCKNSVQERFLLRMKFRRLSRKKYEVVGTESPSRDTVTKLSCWFCGRVFACRDTWMVHRQRHLMEWKQPNCEDC